MGGAGLPPAGGGLQGSPLQRAQALLHLAGAEVEPGDGVERGEPRLAVPAAPPAVEEPRDGAPRPLPLPRPLLEGGPGGASTRPRIASSTSPRVPPGLVPARSRSVSCSRTRATSASSQFFVIWPGWSLLTANLNELSKRTQGEQKAVLVAEDALHLRARLAEEDALAA